MGRSQQGSSIGPLIAIAGIGLAAASGISVEEGMQKVGGYVDAGIKAASSSSEIAKVSSEIDNLTGGGRNKELIFIGTAEIERCSLTEEEMLRSIYPELFGKEKESREE